MKRRRHMHPAPSSNCFMCCSQSKTSTKDVNMVVLRRPAGSNPHQARARKFATVETGPSSKHEIRLRRLVSCQL
ncbi:hypothetical protein B0T16DRAFT_413331 [Cercophora newfieldiana]|uniref:Uncharacterized protein n=1 Tax=Cercophora newfieldiana TaxID=92897 RepID=A0AA39Y7Q2_9PEZI|nr:hypothetical protein B0T16DRAFT_413331 [Cercophora newfieldiana]